MPSPPRPALRGVNIEWWPRLNANRRLRPLRRRLPSLGGSVPAPRPRACTDREPAGPWDECLVSVFLKRNITGQEVETGTGHDWSGRPPRHTATWQDFERMCYPAETASSVRDVTPEIPREGIVRLGPFPTSCTTAQSRTGCAAGGTGPFRALLRPSGTREAASGGDFQEKAVADLASCPGVPVLGTAPSLGPPRATPPHLRHMRVCLV